MGKVSLFKSKPRVVLVTILSSAVLAGVVIYVTGYIEKHSPRPKIGYLDVKFKFNTGSEERRPFFRDLKFFLGTACQDIGMNYDVINLTTDNDLVPDYASAATAISASREIYEQLKKVIERNDLDGFLVAGTSVLVFSAVELCEMNKKPVVVFNSNEFLNKIIGSPGEKYRFYIASIKRSDENIGYTSAKSLIDNLKTKSEGSDSVKIVSLSGLENSIVSSKRLAGLERFISEISGVELMQKFTVSWIDKGYRRIYDYDIAREKIKLIIKRYRDLDGVWCESDSVASGVLDGLRDEGLIPGKDVQVVGIDGTRDAVSRVLTGDLLSTTGGYIYNGALSAVILKEFILSDYSEWEYFEIENSVEEIGRKFLSENNVKNYNETASRIDFSKMRFHGNKNKNSDFSIKNILQTLR